MSVSIASIQCYGLTYAEASTIWQQYNNCLHTIIEKRESIISSLFTYNKTNIIQEKILWLLFDKPESDQRINLCDWSGIQASGC
jgi:hypothetical protein